jgi:AcrR family transcriptional regulator
MATDVTGDELEPPWWRPPRRRGRRRDPLSRDDIVEAAVRVVDAEGVDALTIRRLGQELDTGSATLYWHISGKDELGELVHDRIMGEIELPEPDPSHWQEQLRELTWQYYSIMLSHNDAVRLSLGRVGLGPNMLRLIEWLLDLLRRAGVPDVPAALFGDILGRYLDASVLEVTMATSPRGADGSQEAGAEMMRDYLAGLPSDRFPNILALAPAMATAGSDQRFRFGLDVLIRGLAALVDAQGREADSTAGGPAEEPRHPSAG